MLVKYFCMYEEYVCPNVIDFFLVHDKHDDRS